ncbi:hypothetical protein AMTR_s00001p00261020 [Amborella trichopoda]|uniref:Pentacotripeptide-repeat region of PRORP domain-containing protein n=1 Tax=Amborella trichopoda TaxID=13333 RepID=W1NLV4_AMBTC|nr:hypothetical protein AMTR_s00001p00261020 [Amborella trichopoda]
MSISESRLDAIIWNSLLGAYARSNTPQAALIIYKQMQNLSCPHRDRFTYSFLLKACTDPSLRDKKGEIHCHIIKTGFHSQIYVRTSLLVVYSTSGCLSDACKVFNEMPKKNVVICNAMITGYGKHGKIDDARKLFDEMMKRSVVSWSAMIDGYITNNRTREAFALFRFMLMEENENKPNEITILSILPALQHGLGASHIGDSIHAFARKMVGLAERVMERVVELEREFGGDYVLLSNIYAGAGRWSDAEKVRRSMEERNLMKTLGSSNLL